MKLLIHGDRSSFIVKIGRKLMKKFPNLIRVVLWDGYKTKMFFEKRGD